MAIDTRNKRASAIAILLPWRWMLPAPDGTITSSDRQQVAGIYAGIAALEEYTVTLDDETWANTQPVGQTWTMTQPDGETWKIVQPVAEAWANTQPDGETFKNTQPVGETWSVT